MEIINSTVTSIEDYSQEGQDNLPNNDPKLAKFLAFHLVSQILDEAYIIANAAKESGQPWRYIKILNYLRSGKLGDADDECLLFMNLNNEDKSLPDVEHVANNLTTSTPQKNKVETTVRNNTPEINIIGQGDEDIDLLQTDLSKATSMFINNLFDMSEVACIYDEPEIKPADNWVVETDNGAKFDKFDHESVMLHYNSTEDCSEVASALSIIENISIEEAIEVKETDNDGVLDNIILEGISVTTVKEKYENVSLLCENAYLTLNRDFDQGCEDDLDTILQDPKALTMDEIELLKVHDTEEDVTDPIKKCTTFVEDPTAVPSSSKKSKCKTNSFRFLTCLRGWWRRRGGKREDEKKKMCSGSPDLLNRSCSLPRPHGSDRNSGEGDNAATADSQGWKFNSVNETLCRSKSWKKYEN